MQVVGTIELEDSPISFSAKRIHANGSVLEIDNAIQSESILSVYVNDILTMQLGCSASHLVELVVGRLFTEGLVAGIDDIAAISICDNNLRADVVLADREADLSRKAAQVVPTCCTTNRTLNDYFRTDDEIRPVVPIPWDAEWLFRVAEVFELDHTSHSRTHGTHSAYLATREAVLYCREDIGRHNAFDKVVGSALIDGVDLGQCLLFTSGRVPTDMVAKAIRSGLPILVSKAVATDKTVELARGYDLTLVCNATTRSLDVLSDPLGMADMRPGR